MTIDLQKYYSGNSESVAWKLDLTGMELDGVKPFCAPVEVQGQLRGSADSVEFFGTVTYTMTKPCDRCNELTTQKREFPFSHVLVRELSDEEDEDVEFVVVPNDQLDGDRLITEDLLLDLPSKFLCSPDCKGLCATCGKNLNEGPCDCDKRVVDPRLAILEQLL